MIHNDRIALALHDQRIAVDHNLFEVTTTNDVGLAAMMTATYQAIVRELLGRINLGQGGLKTEGVDIVRLIAINPIIISSEDRDEPLSAFNRLASRPIRSIFEELGFVLCEKSRRRCSHPEHPYEHVKPEALTLEQVKQASPDRFELDRVVFDVLGLTDEERLEVYRAVVGLVKDRLVKARSV